MVFFNAASWLRSKIHGWGWSGGWLLDRMDLMVLEMLKWWTGAFLALSMSSGRQWRWKGNDGNLPVSMTDVLFGVLVGGRLGVGFCRRLGEIVGMQSGSLCWMSVKIVERVDFV